MRLYVLTQGEYDSERPVGIYSSITNAQAAPFDTSGPEPREWFEGIEERWYEPSRDSADWYNDLTDFLARRIWAFELDKNT